MTATVSRPGWASDLLDTTGFVEAVSALPESLVAALQLARARAGSASGGPGDLDMRGRFSHVVVAGVGPDATVAQMFAAATADTIAVPVVVVGDGSLPAFVGPASLVVVADGPSATPEAFRAVSVAGERGASLVVIAPAGRLATYVEGGGGIVYPRASDADARRDLAQLLVPLYVACEHSGLLTATATDAAVAEAARALAERRDKLMYADGGAARTIARRIGRTLAYVHGADGIGAVAAQRWVEQLNLTAKSPAFCEPEPHRSTVGVAGYGQQGDVTRQLLTLVQLRTDFEPPESARRFRLAEAQADEAVAGVLEVHAVGDGTLAQLLDLVLLGDLVAVHRAADEGLDPGPVPAVESIARELAASCRSVDDGSGEPGDRPRVADG